MDFQFDLATPEDDAALRRVLATSAMPGRITVTFEREPNYFLGCGVMGPFCQVLLARQGDEIAGMLCRAVRAHFINGQAQDLGYIGQVRIVEKYRSMWLLLRWLPAFRQLHADGRAPVCWGVISEENAIARGVLIEKRRPAFPTAHEVTRIYTAGIILSRLRPLPRATPYAVRRGAPEDLAEIVAFLQREGAAKQFFPVYTMSDFTGDAETTRGFAVQDFFVARQKGVVVGVIGLWDQSSYKQTVVRDYSDDLRRLRPWYNLGAHWLGAQPLPAPGEHIRSAYASFICVAGNNPAIFAALLPHVCMLAAARGFAYLMLGLSAQDPLLAVAKRQPHIAYHSRLYVGYWDEGGDFYERLDSRIPYIEIAAL